MLSFKSFDIKLEQKEIVKFLKDNNDRLLSKGGTYHEGRICFFFSTEPAPVFSDADQDKNAALEYTDKKITEYKAMILDSDSIILYWKGMIAKSGDKKISKTEQGYMSAAEMVDRVTDQRENQSIQLAAFKDIREQIESGKYSFVKPAIAVKKK